MNTIYIICVGDCEGSTPVSVCATKEIAEREILKERDKLVKEWQQRIEEIKQDTTNQPDHYIINMYSDMINNLSSDEYENWNNYPHERPYIKELQLISE